jgi:hypothetical protein
MVRAVGRFSRCLGVQFRDDVRSECRAPPGAAAPVGPAGGSVAAVRWKRRAIAEARGRRSDGASAGRAGPSENAS